MSVDEREVRIQKMSHLLERGVDPFPDGVNRSHMIKQCLDMFEILEKEKTGVCIAGRIRSIRAHGGSTFFTLEDESGQIQLLLRKDEIGEEPYNLFKESSDIGDIYECRGILFLTKTGEKTLHAHSFRILSKALLPLPDKWHGLQDVEMRYRHRELDLLSDPEIRTAFIVRSKFISALRSYLDEHDFLEVETPILQPIPGGAQARPFITHHNALDCDFYLRIAPELYLKRLLVGGFEKIYEIGRQFRNEGIDHAHAPEFTMIELYVSYCPSKEYFIQFLEDLLRYGIEKSLQSLVLPLDERNINFSGIWERKTFREVIFEKTGLDIDTIKNEEDIEDFCRKKGYTIDFTDCVGIGEWYDQFYKKTTRFEIIQPTWIFDYPIELKPLTQALRDDPTKSASAQLVIDGSEIINAYYHELNNPLEQRDRFTEQEALRERGSNEAQYLDEDFLFALEHGMPPTSGMGMGIDRLVELILNKHSVKEVILFPTLKPKI